MAPEIKPCTPADFNQILEELPDFWGSDRTRAFHHPMFVREFGNTSFVIKEQQRVIAYLFGFFSQTEKSGYVHLIGVRQSHQRRGLGHILYQHFIKQVRAKGFTQIKAITTPANEQSIQFHLKLGMRMLGDTTENGYPVVADYSGPGQHRVVFTMDI